MIGPWLRGWDSNPQPQGYEPCELPIALPRVVKILRNYMIFCDILQPLTQTQTARPNWRTGGYVTRSANRLTAALLCSFTLLCRALCSFLSCAALCSLLCCFSSSLLCCFSLFCCHGWLVSLKSSTQMTS